MINSRKCIAVSWLPSTGLANKLYVWVRGYVWAKNNEAPHYCFGWSQPKIGPIMRREASTRLYLNQIRKEGPIRCAHVLLKALLMTKIYNPRIEKIEQEVTGKMFIFRDLHVNSDPPEDSFRSILPFRDNVREALHDLLQKSCKELIENAAVPIIAIHVRRGDFSKTEWWQPIEDFCVRLNQVRAVAGKCLPATVFSDGSDDDLTPLLEMPSVTRATFNPEIVDILLLSRSRVLIASRASTFSNWAGFLSDGVILRDPKFCHQPSRPDDLNARTYEGPVSSNTDEWPELLKVNLATLGSLYSKGLWNE